MKSQFSLYVFAGVMTGLLPVSVHANTHGTANLVPPGAPPSVFVHQPIEPGFGKDPFFPKTKRFEREIPKNIDDKTPDPIVPDEIALKGISFIEDRKLAIINNHTAAEGEEFSLRIKGQTIKVKCVEIKDTSVIISVNDTTKEISLRTILQ